MLSLYSLNFIDFELNFSLRLNAMDIKKGASTAIAMTTATKDPY